MDYILCTASLSAIMCETCILGLATVEYHVCLQLLSCPVFHEQQESVLTCDIFNTMSKNHYLCLSQTL